MLINIITVIIAVIVISFIIWWFFGNHESAAGTAEIVDGQQLATISVDGGYSPETLIFKQGMPAKLTFNRKDPSTSKLQPVSNMLYSQISALMKLCQSIKTLLLILIPEKLENMPITAE